MNLDVEAHPSSGLPAFYYILFNVQRKILAQAFAYVVSGMYGDPLGSLSGEVSPRGFKVSNRNTWAPLQYLSRSIGIRSTVHLNYGEYHPVPFWSSVDLIRYFVCKNPCSFSEEQ